MPILSRFPPPPPPKPELKKLLYHQHVGTLDKPPFNYKDIPAWAWRSGEITTCNKVRSRKLPTMGKPVVLGWSSGMYRGLSAKKQILYGVWVASKIGFYQHVKGSFGKEYVGLDPYKDFEYVGQYEGVIAASDALREAFEEKHEVYLP